MIVIAEEIVPRGTSTFGMLPFSRKFGQVNKKGRKKGARERLRFTRIAVT